MENHRAPPNRMANVYHKVDNIGPPTVLAVDVPVRLVTSSQVTPFSSLTSNSVLTYITADDVYPMTTGPFTAGIVESANVSTTWTLFEILGGPPQWWVAIVRDRFLRPFLPTYYRYWCNPYFP